METIPFEIEFHLDGLHLTDDLKAKVSKRIEKLTKGHKDITGASVGIKKLTGSTTVHMFKARVVVYHRPENIAANEKGESVADALNGALDAVDRQVRQQRDLLRERWKRHS